MLKLHPVVLTKNGKKEFVVLPYEEFLALQEQLSDAEDLMDLRKAKRAERKKKGIPLSEVKRALSIQ
jgi:PHD/YefM family antitoxin component YafN of YafNO toxin-antitoxin module